MTFFFFCAISITQNKNEKLFKQTIILKKSQNNSKIIDIERIVLTIYRGLTLEIPLGSELTLIISFCYLIIRSILSDSI